ncbi:hypothetical protein GO988_10515 [Hymenobacter sp. HMF4947]|uniref:DUF6799 domain-containing protein n=1 Tax=Hymenobacter ginkgonis TaxID=2682976 RepID=A0A7K1TED3_9BACT|nr:DUF6799 domain-containing protein [Hymenobacter ginkgonis]MVN76754.1 hypothetical protein [Hymenobacter ginkgonis]
MKVFATMLPALVLAGSFSLAQAQQAMTLEGGRPPRADRPPSSRRFESGVLMKEGKMLTMQNGTLLPMTQTMTMSDGTQVMTDGSVKTADGKSMMLHNGQIVLPDGRVLDRSQLKGNGKLKRSL